MDSSPSDITAAASNESARRDYWCFISYRHADNKEPGRQWATWLHQALETYEVPADLVGTTNERGDVIPDRIFPVFRDEEELPADAQLSQPIEAALRKSRFLVVLCSPQAARSRFVADEILTFKKLGKKDRILAAIIEGEPNASDDPAKGGSEQECFPQPLRFDLDDSGQLTANRTEPIAANFRLPDGMPGWTSPAPYRDALRRAGLPDKQIAPLISDYSKQQNLMLLKIVAGVLGVPLGVLTKRDKAYQVEQQKRQARVLRRWLAALAVLVVVAVASAVWALFARATAEEQRKQAIAAKKIAEERHYFSGIQAAAVQMEEGSANAARQTLVNLPKSQRRWEWSALMEWAGAPMLRVGDLNSWMQRHQQKQPELIAQVRSAAKLLPTSDGQETVYIEAPDGSCAALHDRSSTRHGGFACVVTGDLADWKARLETISVEELIYSKNPSVIVRIATENYGRVSGVAFTPDSSMLVVKASLIRDYAEPPVYNPGEKDGDTYIVPIPSRFYPVKSVSRKDKTKDAGDRKPSSNTESDDSQATSENNPTAETQTVDTSGTLRFAGRHGRDIVVVRIDGEGRRERYQWPWPGVRFTAEQPSANTDEETAQLSRVDLDSLPGSVSARVLKLLQPQGGKTRRFFAAVRSSSSGYEGLFFTVGGSALLERWDLEANKLIGQVGTGIQFSEDQFGFMENWGAAYSADGTRIMAAPCAPAKEGSVPGIFDLATGKLIQPLSDMPLESQGTETNPIFGFSPLQNYVYASISDRALPGSALRIAEKKVGGYVVVKRPEDDPDMESRFVGWSPDEKWRYYVSDESTTLRAVSKDGSARLSIPNAVRTGAYEVFDEMAVATGPSADGRFALGSFIFSRESPQPIIRLPAVWIDPAMRSAIFRNRTGNYDVVTGSLFRESNPPRAATMLLKWWINEVDKGDPRSPSDPQVKETPGPAASAAVSPAVSPVLSPAATATASRAPAVSPSATVPRSPSPTPVASAAAPTARPVPSPSALQNSLSEKRETPAPPPSPTLSEPEVDRELNAAYTALRNSLSAAGKNDLKREQIQWVQQRNALINSADRLRFTQERTRELKRRTP
jgi:hypothetical protein